MRAKHPGEELATKTADGNAERDDQAFSALSKTKPNSASFQTDISFPSLNHFGSAYHIAYHSASLYHFRHSIAIEWHNCAIQAERFRIVEASVCFVDHLWFIQTECLVDSPNFLSINKVAMRRWHSPIVILFDCWRTGSTCKCEIENMKIENEILKVWAKSY